jgi:hypothetical protein
MTASRSSTKAPPAKSKRPGREHVPETTRARKREALERFVNKNAKVLAELAK